MAEGRSYWDMTPAERWEAERDGGSPHLKPGEKVDDATWERMTYSERREYSKRMSGK